MAHIHQPPISEGKSPAIHGKTSGGLSANQPRIDNVTTIKSGILATYLTHFYYMLKHMNGSNHPLKGNTPSI